jgi:hypothetical protein
VTDTNGGPVTTLIDATAASMIHQTALVTWLVRTAGKAGVALLVPLLAGATVAAMTGDAFWWGIGSLVGLVTFLLFLTGATAPMPNAVVLEVLGCGDDLPQARADLP